MVKIKLILFGRTALIPCCTHLAAIVEDLATNRTFLMNYPFQDGYITRDKKETKTSLYTTAKNTCCINTVELYSQKTFDALKKSADSDFVNKLQFKWTSNNCSTKVFSLLNDAFNLEDEYVKYFHDCYRWTCCLPCVASLGLLSFCFPAPPILKTPGDEFSLAKWLSSKYGQPTTEMQAVIKAKFAEESESKELQQEKQPEMTHSYKEADAVITAYNKLNRKGIR